MGKTLHPTGKLCPCGCGKLCVKYAIHGRFKGYSHVAPDCTGKAARLAAGNLKKGRPGLTNPRSVPMGTRRLSCSGGGNIYWRIKVAPSGQWPFEHRYLMEQSLGHKIPPRHHVHHRNENTLDNRLENLVILTSGDHTRHHLEISTWAIAYDACILCREATSKHVSHGRCSRCYQRLYRKGAE